MVTLEDAQDRVAASLQGDLGAFESLIRDHQRMVYSICYRMTGSTEDAEDLTQETFIHAHGNLGSFRGEARFSSWLHRIAMNLCRNWRKGLARRSRLVAAFAHEADSVVPGNSGLRERVQDALLQLKPEQRAVVILTCYEGLSHGEAARALECAETTISWRLFIAKKKLKRLLKGCPGPGDQP